jgi:hypothetical protein
MRNLSVLDDHFQSMMQKPANFEAKMRNFVISDYQFQSLGAYIFKAEMPNLLVDRFRIILGAS